MASSIRKEFDVAFRSALDAGESTFEFQGKKYNTKMAPPKTESNRGGARMKSGTDIMDTLPGVGKVKTGEIAPISKTMYADQYKEDKSQTKGFKAEDMGINQYRKPELDDFIPTKKAIPGSFDKPMSKLPGRFPTKGEAADIKKGSTDTKDALKKSSGLSVGLGAEPKEDVQTREQNMRDSIKSMADSDLTPKAGQRPTDGYRKGGIVTAKRSSKRGCGIAVKGFGRAGGR